MKIYKNVFQPALMVLLLFTLTSSSIAQSLIASYPFPNNNIYKGTGQDSTGYLNNSITAGIGLNIVKERTGIYLTGNHIWRLSKIFCLGTGADLFNDSDGDKKTFLLLNVNPLMRFDILKNKVSLFGGLLGGLGISFSREDGSGAGAYYLINFKLQYNFNKKISLGLEYKSLFSEWHLTNIYISINY